MQRGDNRTAMVPNARPTASPLVIRKRIGSTTFVISVHTSRDSKETATDKIFRLIEREAADIA